MQWPSVDLSPSPAKLSCTGIGRRGLYETSSLTYPKYYFHDREEVIKANIRDPLQIVKIIRENEHIGFLYMISAVPRSSIEYDTYNLKWVLFYEAIYLAVKITNKVASVIRNQLGINDLLDKLLFWLSSNNKWILITTVLLILPIYLYL